MGRVNRLMERRALRRAADQALLTSLGVAYPGRPGGPADRDFHYARASRIDVAPPADHEPVTEPIPIADTAEPRSRRPDETPGNGQPPTPVEPPRARSVAEAAYLPTALDFAAARYRGRPWYRTKPAAAAVVAAVIVAVLCTGWVVLHAPSTTAEQSTSEPTSAKPAPTMTPPASAGPVKSPPAPAPPPPPPTPPPPPPPPSVERTYSPSQGQYQPRYTAPIPSQGPRIDVTRAPMSVAPTPKPVQSNDSSAPGDAPDRGGGRRRGCFGFC